MPSPSSDAKTSVFISYAREDKEFAEQFKEILSEHGIQVWLDEAELRPLEKWDQGIKNAILSHDYLIFLRADQVHLMNHSVLKKSSLLNRTIRSLSP